MQKIGNGGDLPPEIVVRLREIEEQHFDRILTWRERMVDADLQNVKDARAREVETGKAGLGFASWGPPAVISLVVTVGFFLVLNRYLEIKAEGGTTPDGLGIMLGALASGFLAVINYYLGSSLGSTLKNAALKVGGKS